MMTEALKMVGYYALPALGIAYFVKWAVSYCFGTPRVKHTNETVDRSLNNREVTSRSEVKFDNEFERELSHLERTFRSFKVGTNFGQNFDQDEIDFMKGKALRDEILNKRIPLLDQMYGLLKGQKEFKERFIEVLNEIVRKVTSTKEKVYMCTNEGSLEMANRNVPQKILDNLKEEVKKHFVSDKEKYSFIEDCEAICGKISEIRTKHGLPVSKD